MSRKNYMAVEAPETSATIDFLDAGASVEIVIDRKARTLRIVAKVEEEGDCMQWRESELEIPLPEKTAP